MTYESYRLIFLIGAILAGAMLVLAVVLFFVLKIPRVIGDLSGANARKAIENIRNQNTQTGEKVHKSSAVNKERGRVTDKISPSGRIKPPAGAPGAGAMTTQKLGAEQLQTGAAETTILDGNETTILQPQSNETTILQPQGNETTLLYQDPYAAPAAPYAPPAAPPAAPAAPAPGFSIVYEITYIHTNEVIA